MTENKNEQQTSSFKRKLGNITYTVKVHFNKDTDKTFKDSVQKLIINECLEKIRNNSRRHLTNLIRRYAASFYGDGRQLFLTAEGAEFIGLFMQGIIDLNKRVMRGRDLMEMQ